MQERFLAKILPEPNSGCWLWTATIDQSGYGIFGIGGSGNTRRAHRVSYELFVNKISKNMRVCHKCDTPSCVNPDHLFCGTDADNALDRKRKKRSAIGEKHGKAKLSEDIVRFIRVSLLSERQLAKELGFHRGTINAVRSGRTWSHVL